MLAGDAKTPMNIRKEANRLAVLNDGDYAFYGNPA